MSGLTGTTGADLPWTWGADQRLCLRAMDCARTPSASRSDFSPERIQALPLVSLEHITHSILVLRGRKLLLGDLECRDHHARRCPQSHPIGHPRVDERPGSRAAPECIHRRSRREALTNGDT